MGTMIGKDGFRGILVGLLVLGAGPWSFAQEGSARGPQVFETFSTQTVAAIRKEAKTGVLGETKFEKFEGPVKALLKILMKNYQVELAPMDNVDLERRVVVEAGKNFEVS